MLSSVGGGGAEVRDFCADRPPGLDDKDDCELMGKRYRYGAWNEMRWGEGEDSQIGKERPKVVEGGMTVRKKEGREDARAHPRRPLCSVWALLPWTGSPSDHFRSWIDELQLCDVTYTYQKGRLRRM